MLNGIEFKAGAKLSQILGVLREPSTAEWEWVSGTWQHHWHEQHIKAITVGKSNESSVKKIEFELRKSVYNPETSGAEDADVLFDGAIFIYDRTGSAWPVHQVIPSYEGSKLKASSPGSWKVSPLSIACRDDENWFNSKWQNFFDRDNGNIPKDDCSYFAASLLGHADKT